MKKIIIILILLTFLTPQAIAKEEIENVFFDSTPETPALEGYVEYVEPQLETDYSEIILMPEDKQNMLHFTRPKSVHSRAYLPINVNDNIFASARMLQNASKFSNMEYNIVPYSSSYAEKLGKFSMGTKYGSDIYMAGNYYSTGIFSRYDDKNFALETGLYKGTSGGYARISDKIYLAPELKLGKSFSLLNITHSYVAQNYNINEVVLRYSPHFHNLDKNGLQFELGAGQYYSERDMVKSAVRFSTNFKL